MVRSFATLMVVLVFGAASFSQQKAEVTISLNEAFFDSALEALFQSGSPLEFSIAENGKTFSGPRIVKASFKSSENECSETIKILPDINGIRTAVRFRDGKIFAPLAFSGNYNPPFVGCVPFSGWADSVIDLEFDQNAQRLVARARVLNVNLNGTGGVGGSVVARLVQSSIDKKINPIEIFHLSKLSFGVPVKGRELQMKATGIRHELHNGAINVVVSYEFSR